MADTNKFDESGDFDLHKKLRDESSTDEEIIKLIQEHPIAVRVVSEIDDENYGLPIKLAIIKNRSIEIIKKLFESFEKCVLTEDLLLFCLTKNIPFDITDFFITKYLNINPLGTISFAKKKTNYLLISLIFKNSLDIIKILLVEFPIKLTTDYDNNNALHIALQNKASSEIIDVLIHEINDQPTYKQRNIQGDLTLHTALKYNVPLEIIKKIVDTNKAALNDKDDSGNLPLHIALKNNYNSELISNTIIYLVNENPETLKIKNTKGYLPIHMLSEITADYDKTRLFTLFTQKYPDSIHVDNNKGKKPYDLLPEVDKQKYKSIIGTSIFDKGKRIISRNTAKVAPLGGGKHKTKRRHRRRN